MESGIKWKTWKIPKTLEFVWRDPESTLASIDPLVGNWAATGFLSDFTRNRHSSVGPTDEYIVGGPASLCTAPVIGINRWACSFHNRAGFMGWGDSPRPTPNQEGQGFPSLSHRFQLVEGAGYPPFTTAAQLPTTLPGATKRGRATCDFAGRACVLREGVSQAFTGRALVTLADPTGTHYQRSTPEIQNSDG